MNESIKNEYNSVLSYISQQYINYVTKKPPSTSAELDTFDKVIVQLIKEIDKYVDKNFVKDDVTVLIVNSKDFWQPIFKKYPYQEYCVRIKQSITGKINEFFIKYSSLVPDDVIENLSNVVNGLMQPIFSTPLDHGVKLDISDAKFNPDDFRDAIKDIGESILKLYKYA